MSSLPTCDLLQSACQRHTARCCSAYTGLDCDISVASGAARFKSTVLRYLADIDSRFGSLVRLVKLWAGAHGMNDAAAGTFNSFALTLMVGVHTAYVCQNVTLASHGQCVHAAC